jgi:hypothetical protein
MQARLNDCALSGIAGRILKLMRFLLNASQGIKNGLRKMKSFVP